MRGAEKCVITRHAVVTYVTAPYKLRSATQPRLRPFAPSERQALCYVPLTRNRVERCEMRLALASAAIVYVLHQY